MWLKQQLTNLGTDDAIFAYLRGLNPKIRELVRSQKDNQADLRTLQNACLRVNTTSNRSNDRLTPQEEAHMISSSMTTPSTNWGGFQGRNGCREGGYRGWGTHRQASHNRGSNNARHPYKKNTSDQTDGPQSKSCYVCESTDHFAVKCPNLPKLREMLNSSDQSANLAIGATIIDSGATQHMFH